MPAQFTYDASGRPSQTTQTTSRVVPTGGVSTTAVTAAESYDGDGAEVRRDTTKRVGGGQPSVQTTYYLRSSVLGGRLVTEYDSAGVRRNSYIPWGAGVVAEQSNADTSSPQLLWRQANPVTGDGRDTDSAGRLLAASHLDPEGADAGESAPQGDPSDNEVADHGKAGAGIELLSSGVSGAGQCTLNGLLVLRCAMAFHLEEMGVAAQCPHNDCGPRFNPNRDGRGRGGWELPYLTDEGFIYAPLGPSTRPQRRPPTLQSGGVHNPQPGNRNPYNVGDEGEDPSQAVSIAPLGGGCCPSSSENQGKTAFSGDAVSSEPSDQFVPT